MRPLVPVLGPLLLLALGGCYASNVVAVHDRAVRGEVLPEQWQPVPRAALSGLWWSASITGEAAASLRKVAYWLSDDGRYTGAALVEGDDGPAFQTLTGRWVHTGEQLVFDDGEPMVVTGAAGEWLRLVGPGGTVVLRREAQQ